jgi:class 3 adenylate cyclase
VWPIRVTTATFRRETDPMADPGDHRIGDAERQQAIDLLRAHTGAGRLTLDEFSDLAGQVYAAQTYRELEDVAGDLPPGLVPEAGPEAGPPRPTDAVPAAGTPSAVGGSPAPARAGGSRGRRRFVAVMSGSSARGRWRAAPAIRAFAFWGSVHIDLRSADVDGPVVDITAWAIMGSVCVTVAEGTRVELDGMVVMGGSTDTTRTAEPLPGSPLVRVHARGMWGGVSARSKKTREQRAAAAEAAGEPADHREGGPPHILELPQRILDDVATMLPSIVSGQGERAPVHRGRSHSHGGVPSTPSSPGRSRPPRAPRPPRPPRPPGRSGPGPSFPPGPPAGQSAPFPPGPPAGGPSFPPTAADPSATAGPGGAPAPAPPTDHAASNGQTPTPGPAAPSGTLTMMVTDIADSTALAERLGDRRWIEVLADHNTLVREAVARHGGTEVKAQGDGFLVVFSSARRAILAGVDVQRALCRYRDGHPDTPVAVRVGLHTGEIVDVDGDVFGQNVVVAVRIADQAVPGEVVVSALTRDLTVSGGDLSFGPATEVALKGLSQPWRVHRVAWSPEPA